MRFFILLFTIVISFSTLAHALEVSPDGPLIVNLREDATSVIVGNPNHATVTLENSRMLLINAGLAGVTNLTVLGPGGKVILNEKVIVNGSSEGYIRVQNACINGGDGCQDLRMFYCEEGSSCHNVVVADEAPISAFSGTVETVFTDENGDIVEEF